MTSPEPANANASDAAAAKEPTQLRVLSGIQPTGRFHWGNYFGAIRQYIDLQHAGDAYYFIADLHALTTVREPEVLRSFVREAALDLVALGLDPKRATLFVQSDVPEKRIKSSLPVTPVDPLLGCWQAGRMGRWLI
jgi:tryptophanyl-tRNA synthetase